jgi:hypothetical protein
LRVSSQLQNRVGNSFLSQNLLFQTSEYFLILAFLEIFCFPPSLIDPYSALIGGVNFARLCSRSTSATWKRKTKVMQAKGLMLAQCQEKCANSVLLRMKWCFRLNTKYFLEVMIVVKFTVSVIVIWNQFLGEKAGSALSRAQRKSVFTLGNVASALLKLHFFKIWE